METTAQTPPAPHLEFLRAISARDLDRVMACYTDDVDYEEPAFHQRLHGHHEVRRSYAELFESMEISLDSLDTFTNEQGDRAVVRWRMRGTVRGVMQGLFTSESIGRPFTIHGVSVLDLTPEHRISRYVVYWNLHDLLQQIGAGTETGTGHESTPLPRRVPE